MPLFNRDTPDESLTSSEDAYDTRLPRRPRPAVTSTSYEERTRSYYASPRKESRRREQRERENEREPSRKPLRSPSEQRDRRERREARQERDRDREERRRVRAAQDPQREALRQERRERRRAPRHISAAEESGYEDPDDDHRQQRRASRRAERRAAEQEHPERRQYPATVDLTSEYNNADLDDVDAQSPLQRTALPRAVDDARQAYPSLDQEQPDHSAFDQNEKHPPNRYPKDRQRRDMNAQARQFSRRESWHSSEDDWTVDLESSSLNEKKHNRSRSSVFSELAYYKRNTIPERGGYDRDDRRGCCGFSRRCTVLSLIVVSIITLIIIITVATVVSKQSKFDFKPSTLQVNNTYAFSSGGATRNSLNDTKDGIGAGTDAYTYYQGNFTHFPESSKWISFEDMWKNNVESISEACGWLKYGEDDSAEEIQDIYNAIQDRANASLVDHRLILAFILQESHGCVRIPHTTSSGGTKNTGLMQAHDGHEYDSKHQDKSILLMVQDGTQGTKNGNGIVQELNAYGNPYAAARAYNSGYIDQSGDLSAAAGATACYVSDIANRLTGWVKATSSCPGSGAQ